MMRITSFLFVFTLMGTGLMAQGSGNLLRFNGSSSYVNCGSINLGGTAVTLQGWVKANSFKSTGPFISSLWGIEKPGSHCAVRLGDAGLSADRVQFIIYNGSTHYKLNGSRQLQTNRWYHIAATYDGSSMKIYIDGVQDVSMSISTRIVTNDIWEIGRNYADSRILDGEIDEVSVFRSALSQNTIREWMCQSIKPSHPNYATLEGYWKLNETSGSTAFDSSGKNRNGSYQNSPQRQPSPLPIGDTCVSSFTNPSMLSSRHPDGDSVLVDSIIGASAAFVYLVNGESNTRSFSNAPMAFDSSRYWGSYFIGNNPRADVEYFFSDNSHFQMNAGCFNKLFHRGDNTGIRWIDSSNTTFSNSIRLKNVPRGEYLLGYTISKPIASRASQGICDGDSVRLSNRTTGVKFQWYKNGQGLLNDTTNSLMAKDSGDYYVLLDQNVCVDTSHRFSLQVNQIPTVSFSPLSAVCASEDFYTLSGGSPAGGSFKHTFVSGNLFVVKNAGPGDYKIVYEYGSQFGCSDTASQMLKVHALPGVNADSIDGVCVDTTDFTLSNGTPSGGDYFVNGTKTNTFATTSLGQGTHWVKYEFTDANNCTNADSVPVVINDLPGLQLLLSKTRFCEYDPAYTPSGHNPFGGFYTGNGLVAGRFDPGNAGAGEHVLTYNYQDPNTRCKNTISDTVEVFAKPATPTITDLGGELSSSTADKYQWYDLNGVIRGETNQTFTPLFNGDYKVRVTINGCNSDISGSFSMNYIGLEELEQNGVRVYPNPFETVLHIELQRNVTLPYELRDIQGRLLKEGELHFGENQIKTEDFDRGSYVLLLHQGDQMEVIKIQK